MKALRLRGWILVGVYIAVAITAHGDGPGTVRGFVRDPGGKGLEGITLILSDDRAPSNILRTKSGPEGKYQFDGLTPGEFHVSAEMAGYLAAKPVAAVISLANPNVSINFTLTPLPPEDEGNSAAQKPPLPKFESAGVRGLVDPGGYSAPANAAAASGLIQGMADIKRGDDENASSAASALPCTLESELQKSVEVRPESAEANRRLGEFYLVHQQPSSAIPFLSRAVGLDSLDYTSSKELALALLQTEQFAAAHQLLTVLTENRNDPTLHQLLARAEEGLGEFQQASLEYQIAAKGNPSEENLFGQGYELILAGLPADAAQVFQSAAKQYPRSVLLLIGAGTAEFLLGRPEESARYLLRATDLDPADARPYPFLISASAIPGTIREKVRESFKRFLDLSPDNPQASYFYAVSLWNSRDSGAPFDPVAVELSLKRAIVLDPGFAKAHYQLAILYSEQSNFLRAVEEYETTLRLAPDMKDVHYRLASAYRRTGQMELATRQMQLFRESHQAEAAQVAGGTITIEQFVSVIAPKGRHELSGSSCSAVQP